MNLETKITIYKFTPQLFTLTQEQSSFCEANSVLYQERCKMYYFNISPFSLKNTVLSVPSLSVRTT